MLDQHHPQGPHPRRGAGAGRGQELGRVTLLDIAEAADLPLAELRGLFASKTDVIAALLRAVDDAVLERAPKRTEGQETRDRLFDVVMTRFDVLAPHKAALKSIYHSGSADFALAGPSCPRSTGCSRPLVSPPTARLAPCAFRASASPTRACSASGSRTTIRASRAPWRRLDRRLRRGERSLGTLERLQTAATRFSEALREGARAARQSAAKPQAGAGPRSRHGLSTSAHGLTCRRAYRGRGGRRPRPCCRIRRAATSARPSAMRRPRRKRQSLPRHLHRHLLPARRPARSHAGTGSTPPRSGTGMPALRSC